MSLTDHLNSVLRINVLKPSITPGRYIYNADVISIYSKLIYLYFMTDITRVYTAGMSKQQINVFKIW